MDQYWLETARFVATHSEPDRAAIAPREFHGSIPRVIPYERATPSSLRTTQFIVLHKGLIAEIEPTVLYLALTFGHVAFSNDVFVVLATQRDTIKEHVHHVQPLVTALASVDRLGPSSTAGYPAASHDRHSCYLGDNRAICTTIHGHKMIVDTSDLSLAPHLLIDGYWENWITRFVKRTIEPDWQVVEVGGNFGYYTLLLADGVGSNGLVTAFEANPNIAKILSMNVEINGFRDRVRTEIAAVSDSSGRDVEFKVFARHMGSSSLFATSEFAASFDDELRTEKVQTRSLDDYLTPGSRIDFLKMDAEGAEPLILKGAERTLRENRDIKILIEFAPSNVEGIIQPRAFLEQLMSIGFTIFRIDEDSEAREKDIAELLSAPHSELYLKRS